ncbi:copper resistance CopC family protein [Pedococcus bigeumensis]|uniref:Copper resistance protein CopC n=1 Tax=Pedococcus bigeumensis TaxID=433644 RepID=A0A502D5Q2_9MICO|nr:copper resistance CopC family protein [Pedococcus bigeumensis]TPG19416.1 copper resistance protein CopC [Pedococcus bigeumensis]
MDSEGKRRVIRIGVWVAILGLLLGVLSSIIMATGADAHAALKSISPKDGSSVSTTPTQVVLTFNEPISTSFATVTVTGADGVVSAGKTVVDGGTVTQALAPDLANGRYTVTYRVVSEDGHPVSDRTTFTVAAATSTPSASETSVPSATPLPATPSASRSSAASTVPDDADAAGSGRGLRIGLAVGVAALALAGGTALVASGRRQSGRDPGE